MILNATRIFDAEGFRGVGIDRVTDAAGVSTRTLYKHFGSRDGLVLAVLQARHQAFMDCLAADSLHDDPVGAVFDTLQRWMGERGARGCLLLRARSEYAVANPQIVKLVEQQKREFLAEMGRRVEQGLQREDAQLATQLWLLFEGAVAAAAVAPHRVIADAKAAALLLLALAKGETR